MKACAQSQGDINHGRSTKRCPVDEYSDSFDRSACAVVVREPEASHLPGEIEHRGSDHRGPALGNGEGNMVIDRRFSLSEVAEALRYLEEGHARGKVAITLEHHNET